MIKRVKVEGVMKGESGVGVTGVICSSGGEGGVRVVLIVSKVNVFCGSLERVC